MTLQALRHPNVLQFLGACMMPPNLIMVTEHMPHSLHAVLYTMQVWGCREGGRVQECGGRYLEGGRV